MTKTQQKLARQATIFVNSGGKAVTAIMRLLLLSIAVIFEAISLIFNGIEEALADTLAEGERAGKRNEAPTFTLANDSDEMNVVTRPDGFVPERATLLTGTGGSLARRK